MLTPFFMSRSLVSAPVTTYPTVLSVTATELTSATTQHLVNMPAAVSTGNLLLAVITNDGSATITTPTDWTEEYTNSTAALTAYVFSKISDGTEGGTTVDFVTSATEQLSAHVFRISNWSGSLTNINALATTGSANPPNLTSGFGAVPTLWIVSGHNSSTTTIDAAPTNYTNFLWTASTLSTTGASLATARRELTAASEDPGAFTITGAATSVISTTIAVY